MTAELNSFHRILEVEMLPVTEVADGRFDGILIVASPYYVHDLKEFSRTLTLAIELDNGLRTEAGVIPLPNYKAGRLIYSPVGCVDEDYDDVRCFRKAANIGIRRAIKAGVTKPMVILQNHPQFNNGSLITLVGVLEGLYVPLQIREKDPRKIHNITSLGVYSKYHDEIDELIQTASLLETGRRIACDIGDSDPERMAPPKVEQYITTIFADTSIKIEVIKDVKEFAKSYPLFEAVNRAANKIERHHGRIMFLEYMPKEEVKKTLFFVGKGVTYDTGGLDVKINGGMAGMSRDKCGAAAVVGFFKIVERLQPKHLRVIGGLGIVRNSIGTNAYVQDELIKARSGVMVRVGNTDAEGRMIMADILCKMKEMAVNAVNPHIYTIATLTGHAVLTAGFGYNIIIDNGPAKKEKHAQKLQLMGEEISDPYEISVLRREDFNFMKGQGVGDDLISSNNKPSSVTPRGHQCPLAFLIMASGLDKHGSGHEKPLKYSHIDIAASTLNYPNPGTGAPVLSLANAHLLNLEHN
ncbi:putative aminopeptidase W07G4.4 isoform X1 [Harmonia axyridis]|uniref:putative aminopeptidase W07G4.4 isoform X1 n=1 Tax=Harmonia axyridis TaxID=115357 RepID=UPI001E27896C|nr:putative aminopeptidase W07G4.4 isoform X1 [Harmonia axyridis]